MCPKFNLGAGGILPPSDRVNLYGLFYSHESAVYSDGIQDGYNFLHQGRAVGGFDGGSAGTANRR